MGAPTSSIFSEIFLQHLEETKLPSIAKKLHLIEYLRYVDDILVLYDSQHTDLNTITHEFNSLHNNIQFTHEDEQDKLINYLDITIQRHDSHISFSVYRKPTYTDSIIPLDSNHPSQHKYAAIRSLYNRLDSYHLQGTDYTREKNIIANILHNNRFPLHTRTHKQQQKPPTTLTPSPNTSTHSPHTPQKWCTFTYTGKETLQITKILKDANLKIAFRTDNSIQKLLQHNNTQRDKYTRSGVYKLTCPECQKAYVGQTGRDFYTRFKEHKRAFFHNTNHSKYAKHLLEYRHPFGNIDDTMTVLKHHRKGPHLNTVERYYIHKETLLDNHINEEYTDTTNHIFNAILQKPLTPLQ
jgi:predicted transcriptional regulator